MSEFEDVSDGTYTGVVDSIEDGLATIFLEGNGDEIGDTIVAASVLPEDGQHADAILSLTIEDGKLVDANYDPERTESRQEAAQDRFDRLSRRPPSDDEES